MAGHGAWKKTLKAKRMREGEVTEHPAYARRFEPWTLGRGFARSVPVEA
jgi:hypothetical protein